MKIEELEDVESERDDGVHGKMIASYDTKRVLVGAGARILFYPTLLYNVFRNKIQAEFRWWDEIDQVCLFFFFSLLPLIVSVYGENLRNWCGFPSGHPVDLCTDTCYEFWLVGWCG